LERGGSAAAFTQPAQSPQARRAEGAPQSIRDISAREKREDGLAVILGRGKK
jgi:hypothetical protein